MERALGQYLTDHWAGSQAGVQVARRLLALHPHGTFALFMARIVDELEEDRAVLLDVMKEVGTGPGPKAALAWAGQRFSALGDLASRALGRSRDLNVLMQLEALMMGTQGRLALWQTLETLQAEEPKLARFDFASLVDRTSAHRLDLERHRLALSLKAFTAREEAPVAPRTEAPVH